jgi:uncharacterized protein YeaC (DUF1315 family)
MLSDQEIRSLRSSASKAELIERAGLIRLSITRTFPEKSENRGLLLRALDEKVNEISPSLPDISPRTLAEIEAKIARAMTVVELAEKLRQYEVMAARYGDVRLALERGKEKWEEREALARRQEQERVEAVRRAQLEDAEFKALVEEVSAKGFTESRQVSNYIMANKLGRKYRNISGVLELERGEEAWQYHGGFPPHIYARLCEALELGQKPSDARVAGFKSFSDLNRESRS